MTNDARERRLVIFGAGAVGRGFVAELFSEAGWTVSFLDVQPELIDVLQREESYRHTTVGHEERTKRVGPVEAGFSTDRNHVMAEVAAATCVATSVGARVLPLIAPSLSEALRLRYSADGPPLDILLCENLHDAGAIMRALLIDGLDDGQRDLLLEHTGFVETSIGRMIPVPEGASGSISDVAVEPYRFLPIDIAAAKTSAFDDVTGLVLDRDVAFDFYGDRKLYVHNMGHFLCAVLGQRAGLRHIWEAIREPTIRLLTRAAMVESAMALSTNYRYPIGPIVDHVDDLLHRFENRALGDTIERVARDPQRKMAPGDRVLGAYRSALTAETPSAHLALAVAVGASALESAGEPVEAVDAHLSAALSDVDGAMTPPVQLLVALRGGADNAALLDLLGTRFDPPSIP